MRKFINKLLYLIIPIVLFLIFLEYELGGVSNTYNYKRKCFEQQLDSVEVLVLGSSQAAYGINPECFGLKGFNLSNVSQSLFYDNRLTMRYVDKMPKLKYAIINVSYFSFGFQLFDGKEAWRDYYYAQFWNINFPELNVFDLKRYSKILLYTPNTAFTYLANRFDVNLAKNLKQNGFYGI